MKKLPPYAHFPQIKAERITLREIVEADLGAVAAISFYDGKPAATIEEAREMQAKIDRNYLDGESIHWGIIDNETNQIVGTCGYYRGFKNNSGELGCVLLPQFRGKGYMSEALRLAAEFGIDHMRLERVWAATSQQNEKAIQLLERIGFSKFAELPGDEVLYELKNGQDY